MNNIHKSSIINHKSQSLKDFVNGFNFPDPDWNDLPVGFPNISKDCLTREEEHLLDGIKLAWYATAGGWKKGLTVSKHGQALLMAIVGVISLISLISFITQPGGNEFTRTVNAASMQVNEAIESTMSAVLKTVR